MDRIIHLNGNDFSDYISLLRVFKDEHSYDKSEVISKYFDCIAFLSQTSDFEFLEILFPDEYQNFIDSSDKFIEKVYDLMYEEAYNAEDDYLESTLEDIESVSDRFGIDCDDARGVIEDKIEKKKKADEASQDYSWDDEYEGGGTVIKVPDENETIRNMFDSLRDK